MATTFKRVQKDLDQVQAQVQAENARIRAGYVGEIFSKFDDLMIRYGVTLEEYTDWRKTTGRGTDKPAAKVARTKASAAVKTTGVQKTTRGPSKLKGRKLNLQPKYRHPKTGATWTGHGRPPAWISEAKNRARFLIV